MPLPVPNLYIVRPNDTLRKIAWLYTGNADNWPLIVAANPHLPKQWVMGPRNQRVLTLRGSGFRYGQTIFLPLGWSKQPRFWQPAPVIPSLTGGQFGRGSVGATGDTCTPSPITNVKPYVYTASDSLYPGALAQKWTGSQKKFTELNSANYDLPAGFAVNQYGDCIPNVWSGQQFKIPASWPDPPQGSTLWNSITMTGTGVGPGTVGPGTVGPGTGMPVGYQPPEEKEPIYKSPYLWGALGIGAGILGIVVVAKMTRKKDTRTELARLERSRLQPSAPARA